MDDEPKTAAEMKEIRLNRKLAPGCRSIKAMADIAASDIAIRKRTANLRAIDWRKKPPTATSRPNPKPNPKEENELDDKRRPQRADARFNKARAQPTTPIAAKPNATPR